MPGALEIRGGGRVKGEERCTKGGKEVQGYPPYYLKLLPLPTLRAAPRPLNVAVKSHLKEFLKQEPIHDNQL